MSFFEELKRRKVIRLTIVYIVAAMVILQGADVLVPALALPEWVLRLVALLLILGFPLAVIMAWHFDWTPDGLKRTDNVHTQAAIEETDSSEDSASAPDSATPSQASVAVLPFVNMSGDEENEYFSDGLSEELLNVLANINSLKVAARTSSFHFKGRTGDIADIAKRLGVASVLEGSVRQSGVKVRITAQLINASNGYHLWSETYDRELDDVFAVQDEIASSVAEALKVQLLGEDVDRVHDSGTSNTEAFQSYLRGVHHCNQGSDEKALRDAVASFERAIELDPDYAKAHAGLAKAWEQLATNDFVGLEHVASKVGDAAANAIELAPELSDGYQVLGRMLLLYKLDLDGAREAINTALLVNPGNAEAQIEFSQMSSVFGEHDAAVEAARRALELDPVSMFANHYMGHSLYFARRYDEAIDVFHHVLSLNPDHPRPHYEMGMCLLMKGDADAAFREVEQEPLGWMRHSGMASTLHHLGRTDEARAAMDMLIKEYGDNGVYQHGQVYAQWGDQENAMASLNRALDIGDPGISQILVDPLLDPVRDKAWFAELLENTGFSGLQK
jgi:serine/threonine-protein kinase